MKKSSFERLPREIWLIIIDLAIASSVIPDEMLNYSNFGRIDDHLRSNQLPPPSENLWARLRLVSQEFHALTGPSPYWIMPEGKDENAGAKCVYITTEQPIGSCMRLARHPNARKIITLSVNYAGPRSTYPDDNAQDGVPFRISTYLASLSNLRSLTMRLPVTYLNTFWQPLNDACPSLTCLVLIYEINAVASAAKPVSFSRLKILDLDHIVPCGVKFPALRHLASGRLSNRQLEAIKKWPRLESLAFRTADHIVTFNWGDFLDIRVLVLPYHSLQIVSRCPRHHPLSHLSIYMRATFPDFSIRLVEAKLERLPGVDRLVVDPKTLNIHTRGILVSECGFAGLQLGYSPCGIIRKSGLLALSLISKSTKRTASVVPPASPP